MNIPRFNFKVLTYCGQYVNEDVLHIGIYATLIPTLHQENETIDTIIQKWSIIKNMAGATWLSKNTIDNLKQCTLVDVTLTLKSDRPE